MAFLDTSISSTTTDNYFRLGFFNTNQAVGGNEAGTGKVAVNLPTDMMLVYYLIWFLYRSGNKKWFPTYPSDKFTDPSKKDYTSRDMKQKMPVYIRRVQTDLKSWNKVFVDGRCDPARGFSTSITHSQYLIHLLNFHYADTVHMTKGRNDWQTFLIEDPFAPVQLKWELRNSIKPL